MKSPVRLLAWNGMPAQVALDDVATRLWLSLETTRISSNEALEAAMGEEQFDLVCPSDYMVERLAREGRLVRLDEGALPNLSFLSGWCRDQAFDPDCRFSVPLAFGTTGFLVGSGVRAAPSWESLFRPRPGQRIGMLGEVREVVGAALLAGGYSLNDTSDEALGAAYSLLMEQHPHVIAYSSEDFLTPVVTRLVDLQHAWSSPGFMALERAPGVGYVVPFEGATLWITTIAIPTGCSDVELAHRVLNELLLPEVALLTASASGMATPNYCARERLPARVRENPTLYPGEDVLARCEIAKDLGEDGKKMDALWQRLMRGIASRDGTQEGSPWHRV